MVFLLIRMIIEKMFSSILGRDGYRPVISILISFYKICFVGKWFGWVHVCRYIGAIKMIESYEDFILAYRTKSST